ncbi:MAG TPA: diguanylate cyclase [Terriglobales bacterium]|nr:diguanylate cyclase [Terriglobales bacterium]
MVRELIPRRLATAVCAACWAFVLVLPGMAASVSSVSLPPNPRYAVSHFGESFGLSAVTVTALAQDRQGFLWMGTQTGLLRYDGSRIRRFEEVEKTTGHYIDRLLMAPDGTLWVKGGGGIAHLKQGHFVALQLPSNAGQLSDVSQGFAVDNENNVFVIVDKGLLRFDGKNPLDARLFSTEDGLPGAVSAITLAADNSVWFVSGDRIAMFPAGSKDWQLQPITNLPEDRVIALLFDGHGTLWLRTAKHVARLDPKIHQMVLDDSGIPPVNADGLPSVDQEGDFLVPSLGGLFRRVKGRWRPITDKQGLSSNSVITALEDREGILWVSGMGTGLDRVVGINEWSAWTKNEGLPGWLVWDVTRDHQGRLWIGTSNGLALWDGNAKNWRVFTDKDGLAGPEVQILAVAGDGAIWTLSRTSGITRVDAHTFQMQRLRTLADAHLRAFGSLEDARFMCLQSAPDGQVWVAGRGFIVRFDPRLSPFRPIPVTVPIEMQGSVRFLSFSKQGVLWAAGARGLGRFDGRTWQLFNATDGLLAPPAILAAAGDNDIWISYNDAAGITHLQVDASGSPKVQQFPLDVSVMGKDSHGQIWCGGIDGLVVIAPDGSTRAINHSDGLIWDDTSPMGFWEEKDGSLLIGTSRGLAHYIPRGKSADPKTPDVALTSVVMGDQDWTGVSQPVAEYKNANLAAEFTPLTLRNPDKVQCRYQLLGLEPKFTETILREVRYPALPPGDYQLLVQCRMGNSAWSGRTATLTFEVKPPWWQTWWANLAAFVFLAVNVWFIIRLRTRAINARRKELEVAVAERSAELLRKNLELQEISLTDPLTRARNRRYFHETIGADASQAGRAYQRAQEEGTLPADHRDLIFLMVDLDFFKAINDRFGHAAGDRLLQEVALRLASAMRKSDELVRWGGEEFLIISRSTERAQIPAFCARLLEIIADEPFDLGPGLDVWMTCSIGWTSYPWLRDDVDALPVDDVLKLADQAMYCAKKMGRNQSVGLLPSAEAMNSREKITLEKLGDAPKSSLVEIVSTQNALSSDAWRL